MIMSICVTLNLNSIIYKILKIRKIEFLVYKKDFIKIKIKVIKN